MEFVRSPDGTRIAYHAAGHGRPLVLVHGTGDTYARWLTVLPELESRFRVFAMDRRGHGESGDGAHYSIEREFEDAAAVMDTALQACGEPPAVLGHSFGGLCALEGCLISRGVARLVLYEPPLPVPGEPIHAAELQDALQQLLDRGDLDGIWEAFLRQVMRMTDREIVESRAAPSWKGRVAMAPLLPREVEARAHYCFDASAFRAWRVPTLLLQGSSSPRFLHSAIQILHAALPGSRVTTLQGQGHVAMASDPALFLSAFLPFLQG